MNTQSNGQKTSVVGVVTAAYDPEKRERLKDGATYISPGRIYLDVKGTVCEVSCWSVDSDKVNMPPFWTGIDFDTLEGRTVVISATYDKEYTNPNTNETKHQYKSPTDIQYLDGDAPTPKEATPEPTEPTPTQTIQPSPRPIDQNQMRIMRQSTLHYASLLMVPIVKDFDHPQTMVERTIWLAGKLLEYVITGEMPFEPEVEADEPDEEATTLDSF